MSKPFIETGSDLPAAEAYANKVADLRALGQTGKANIANIAFAKTKELRYKG
ncbi:MAG: hypothetical protein ACE14P_06360 [Methanotrichaceae archaeon]